MYRQIFKNFFFFTVSSRTKQGTSLHILTRVVLKKKKKKKKSIWELNASATDTRMWQSKISNKPDQPRSHGLFPYLGVRRPTPRWGKGHGNEVGAKKQFSACVFNFVHFSFSRLPQNNNVKSPRKWQIYRRSPPGCLPCQNKPVFPKSANQPNEMVLTICNCSRLMRLESGKFSKW